MKHIRLYQTTSAMNADLSNLEKPYIAVAEDNLNSPVIEKYVAATPLKLYITQEAHNNTLGIYVNGSIINEYTEETNDIPWGVTGSLDLQTSEYSYYIEVNAGDVISAEYTEGGTGFTFWDVDTCSIYSSETGENGSNPATVTTVGQHNLLISWGYEESSGEE